MNYTTKQAHFVDYRDLEWGIEQEFKQPFDVACALEASNDTAKTMRLQKKSFTDTELSDLEYFRLTGSGEVHLRMLMQDMVNRNIIPEGEYVIHIIW